jgi:hypothetical protein
VSARITIQEGAEGTTISIVAPSRWPMVGLSLFLLLGAAGLLHLTWAWFVDDLAHPAPREPGVEAGASFFLVVVAGAAFWFSARLSLRALRSREVITVTPDALFLRRAAGLYAPRERFALAYLRRLRATPELAVLDVPRSPDLWRYAEGRNIAFDYGARTVRFGLRLTQAEAARVVAQLARLVPADDTPFSYPDPSAPPAEGGPPAPRARLQVEGRDLHVTIPARRNVTLAVLCGLGLILAIAYGVTLIPDLRRNGLALRHGLFPVLLLVYWYVSASRALMWTLFGKEEILLAADGRLELRRDSQLARPRRLIHLNEVGNLQVSMMPGTVALADGGFHRGNVRLWSWRTRRWYRFGIDLDEAEAVALVRLLEARAEEVQQDWGKRQIMARNPGLWEAISAATRRLITLRPKSVYLTGGIALGSYSPEMSDVDLVVIVPRPAVTLEPRLTQVLAAVAAMPAPFSLLFVEESEFLQPAPQALLYSAHDASWTPYTLHAMDLLLLRKHAMRLQGMDYAKMLKPVEEREVMARIVPHIVGTMLPRAQEALAARPDLPGEESQVVDLTFVMARGLFTRYNDRVASKPEAARWLQAESLMTPSLFPIAALAGEFADWYERGRPAAVDWTEINRRFVAAAKAFTEIVGPRPAPD